MGILWDCWWTMPMLDDGMDGMDDMGDMDDIPENCGYELQEAYEVSL
jgi:hypothetical protein